MDKWFKLHPKFKTALGFVVAADGGLALAVLQGTGTWKELAVGIATSVLALTGTYFGNTVDGEA